MIMDLNRAKLKTIHQFKKRKLESTFYAQVALKLDSISNCITLLFVILKMQPCAHAHFLYLKRDHATKT